MKGATPGLRDIARRLVEYEAGGRSDAVALAEAAARANQRLRQHLCKLVGPAGFHALVSRALVLAKGEYPVLQGVTVNADGDLSGMAAVPLDQNWQNEHLPALSAVLANFLWLLVTFIGDDLALRLVQDLWPDVPLADQRHDSEEASR
jgi:hypothetical protein